MTICWHVDDLFVGHADPNVVTDFLKWLANQYDTADKNLNITRGNRHDYLGMTIDFSHDDAVAFDMIPYIKKNSRHSLKRLQGCLLHLQRIISSLFARPPKPNFFLKSKLVHSITQWHNYYFFLELDVISKLLLRS